MTIKLLILAFLGLLSVVSPPVFIGILLIVVMSVSVCNFDISVSRFSKKLPVHGSTRPIKLPCNLLVIGILFPLAFAIAGLAWGTNPHFADQALETLRMCITIVLHFCSLMLMVGSMYKFIGLVD